MELCANVLTPEARIVPNMLACTGPLEEVFPRLRDFGYGGVELITVNPAVLDLSMIDRLLAASHLTMPAVNTGRLCGELGLTLSDPDPVIRERALARTKEVIDFASHWGAVINMGILRGQYLDSVSRQTTYRLMVDAAKELCDYAENRGVRIAIETVCFMQSNSVNTLEEAEQMIRDVGRGGLGVMYDLFQMYLEERDIYEAISHHISRCCHVHFADSNRLAPGHGAMDFKKLIAALNNAGYQGPCSIEIRPVPDQFTAAKQAADYLLPFLDAV